MARALLPRNKLLILDEATASVDHSSDQRIQLVLRTHFSHATVLVIAHRRSSIMAADRVMLLDQGLLVAIDSPEVVLAEHARGQEQLLGLGGGEKGGVDAGGERRS